MRPTNPCGNAHLQNTPCRQCDRIRAQEDTTSTQAPEEPLADAMIAECMKEALTPAEKQKAYRERLKADPVKWNEYLERDRERKHNG